MTGRGAPGTWQHLAVWDGQEIALEETLAALPCSDADAARALMGEYPGWLHYRHVSGWHVWDGTCHRPDDRGMVAKVLTHWADRMAVMLERARQAVTARVMLNGDGLTETQMRKAIAKAWEPWERGQKYAAGLHRNAGRAALTAYLAELAAVPEDYLDERNPDLLNTASGTVDLRTGQVRAWDPADRITYCLPAHYRPGAACPGFLRVVSTVCGGNAEVMWYLVKLLGYCLVGDNREQKVIFIAGPSGNGKSTLTGIVSEVLGELAHESQAELITVAKHGRNARTENSIRGRRLVTITETSEYMSIEEAQLKRLTGERVISVNQHYAKQEIRARATWTILITTNELPNLTNFDAAVKRRVLIVPGGPSVPADAVDERLAEKILAEESEGILALLISAAGEYYRSRLAPVPLEVAVTTDKYAQDQDTVTAFLADCVAFSLNGSSPGISQPALWEGYRQWSRGAPHMSRNAFYAKVRTAAGMNYNDTMRRFDDVAWKPGLDPAMFGGG